MANFDIFNGNEIAEGRSALKKMCLNCTYCVAYVDGYRCKNENVLEKGREKIMAAIPDDYIVSPIQIKEMNLKNPVKKCAEYSPDIDYLYAEIKRFFASEEGTVQTAPSE